MILNIQVEPHDNHFKSEEDWSAPKVNRIIPREKRTLRKACVTALGVVFYITLVVGSILGAIITITSNRD